MTRRHLATLRLLLMLGDAVSAVAVFLAVSVIRFRDGDPTAVWSVGIDIGPAALLFALLWVAVFWSLGQYHLRVRWSLFAEAQDVARATVALGVITLAGLFVLHQDDVSRVFLVLLFLAQSAGALVIRALLRTWFEHLRSGGRNATFMLIAGTGELAQAFADEVESHASLGVRVIGHVSVPANGATARFPGERGRPSPVLVTRPILGSVGEMQELYRGRVVDEVAVCLP